MPRGDLFSRHIKIFIMNLNYIFNPNGWLSSNQYSMLNDMEREALQIHQNVFRNNLVLLNAAAIPSIGSVFFPQSEPLSTLVVSRESSPDIESETSKLTLRVGG